MSYEEVILFLNAKFKNKIKNIIMDDYLIEEFLSEMTYYFITEQDKLITKEVILNFNTYNSLILKTYTNRAKNFIRNHLKEIERDKKVVENLININELDSNELISFKDFNSYEKSKSKNGKDNKTEILDKQLLEESFLKYYMINPNFIDFLQAKLNEFNRKKSKFDIMLFYAYYICNFSLQQIQILFELEEVSKQSISLNIHRIKKRIAIIMNDFADNNNLSVNQYNEIIYLIERF